MTPGVLRVLNASEWGTKSVVAHNWADWLHNPYCLGRLQRFRATDKTNSGRKETPLGTIYTK